MNTPELDFRCWDWVDMVSTGVDPRQLRNALDRGILKVGAKRGRRIMFSMRERFVVALFASLTKLWMPVSIAAQVATQTAGELDQLIELGSKYLLSKEVMLIIWDSDEGVNTSLAFRSELPGIVGAIVVSLSVIALAQMEWLKKIDNGDEDVRAAALATFSGFGEDA